MSLVLTEEVVLSSSAAQSATKTYAGLQNLNGRAIIVNLNTTVIGTATVTITVDGFDAASQTYYNILTGTAVSTNAFTRFIIDSNATAAAGSIVRDYLPPVFRVVATLGGTGNATYSLGYVLSRA